MADKNIVIRRHNGSLWENIYPKTTINQVVDLSTSLANMQESIDGKLGSTAKAADSDKLDGNQANDFAYAGANDGSTGAWHYTNANITEYTDGMSVVLFVNNIPGISTGTMFEINNLGSYYVYYTGDSKLTTHYSQESVVIISWDADQSRWYCHDFYDSTDDYRIRWQNDVAIGAYVHGYQLLMEGVDGKFYPVTEGGSTANTNTVSTQEMRVKGKLLYYGSGTDAPAGVTTSGYEIYEGHSNGEMEYWNNRDSGWAVDMMPVYLVGTINANGNFVLDNTTYTSFLTQDLPTSEDGKVYVMIGFMDNTYDAWRLTVDHPWYIYKDGRIQEYVDSDLVRDDDPRLTFDDTPVNGQTAQAISSNWAYDHSIAKGNGTHVPALGSTGQFLAHNGAWATPPNDNTWRGIVDNLTTGGTTTSLSAEQGKVLKGYIDAINTLLTSDETTLDTLQEVVDYIETNRATLDALGISGVTGLQAALDAKFDKTGGLIDGNVELAEDHTIEINAGNTALDFLKVSYNGGASVSWWHRYTGEQSGNDNGYELWSSGGRSYRITQDGVVAFDTTPKAGGQLLVKTDDSRLSDARTPIAHTHDHDDITDFDTAVLALSPAGSRPASDVYAWAKTALKPSYYANEIAGLDATHRWLTDAYISTWNSKMDAWDKDYTDLINKPTLASLGFTGDTDATNAGATGDAHAGTAHAPSNAEANVQSDWDATSGDAFILNKPTSLPASDVSAWAKAATKPSYDFSEITGSVDDAQLPYATSTEKGAIRVNVSGSTLYIYTS